MLRSVSCPPGNQRTKWLASARSTSIGRRRIMMRSSSRMERSCWSPTFAKANTQPCCKCRAPDGPPAKKSRAKSPRLLRSSPDTRRLNWAGQSESHRPRWLSVFLSFDKGALRSQGAPSSTVLPFWLPLVDESLQSFFSVARHQVLDHDFRSIPVGVGQVHFCLPIVTLFADFDDVTGFFGDLAREGERFLAFGSGINDVVDQPYAIGIVGGRGISRQQHFHGVLAGHIARQRDHRR